MTHVRREFTISRPCVKHTNSVTRKTELEFNHLTHSEILTPSWFRLFLLTPTFSHYHCISRHFEAFLFVFEYLILKDFFKKFSQFLCKKSLSSICWIFFVTILGKLREGIFEIVIFPFVYHPGISRPCPGANHNSENTKWFYFALCPRIPSTNNPISI